MNYLFFLGIIAPTLITILLFVIFVYCWFLQKARKEVLTKKYDPHGKMRRLGIPMDPPPPPPYCRIDDRNIFVDNGEDNEAYDVSRSPSTEQEARGRPLYHTYHDSGISAGLSPSQENEPRPGLSYRTCPDSGISGFSVQGSITGPPQHQACRGCCQAREHMPQIHSQPYLQQQQQTHHLRPHNLHQQPQQVMLHHNTVQASVHPTHGVCYGDDMTHPQSPQHYNPPPMQPSALGSGSQVACGGRVFTTMPHIHEQPANLSSADILEDNLCYYPQSPDHQAYNADNGIPPCCQDDIIDGLIEDRPPIVMALGYPSTFRPQTSRAMALNSMPVRDSLPAVDRNNMMNIQTTPLSANQLDASPSKSGYPPQVPKPLASSQSSSQLPRHSYRDSGVQDVCQTQSVNDRPDSQASTSSTTDSEDSGFRSSHCAAHHGSKLNKQGNPLLKPLRRPKNLVKTRPKPTKAGDEGDPSVHGATPLSTLNPQHLQCQVPSNNKPHVIQTTSLHDNKPGQRSPPRILQQQKAMNCTSNSIQDTPPMPTSANNNYQNDSSGCHSPSVGSNQETNIKQNMDMTEISTHLSWKYLQDLSVSSNSSQETSNSQDGLQLCHTNLNKAPQFHASEDSQIEMFGYSIV